MNALADLLAAVPDVSLLRVPKVMLVASVLSIAFALAAGVLAAGCNDDRRQF